MLRTLVLLACLPAAACTYALGDPHVLVTSTPPGAEIWLNGEASGRTTPAKLDLGGVFGSDHEITLRKPGYRDETRRVYHYTTTAMARWNDGAPDEDMWPWPLFWSFGDFVLPFTLEWRYVPHEVHAWLYKNDAPAPVTAKAR
jgi:hypothetical protein